MTHVARSSRVAALLVGTLVSACTSELAPTRAIAVRVAKGAWADSLAVAEIATLAVTITTTDGEPITGVGLTWASTDSSVATVSRAPSGGPSESLRAVVIGRGAGTAAIVVRITQAGIATDSLRVPVVVRRSGSDSLTVGDITTVGVTLARTDAAWRTGAKVDWASNDPSVAQVVVSSTDPTKATVTARASGRAQVAATVTSDRLERAVLQLPIRVGAVQLSPTTVWPDTLTVTDTMRLRVNTSRVGATVRWSSTNVAAFRVDANGGVTAYAQGGGEIVASVGDAGFQVAEFRKTLVVLPLVVVERTPWASSINLTNTQQFDITVQDAFRRTKVLPVTWRSTNETAFTVDASGSALGKSRGGGELIATVGAAPFQVSELRKSISVRQKWSSVTAGFEHTCAIADVDRSAWCWGDNTAGELGNGASAEQSRSLPGRVATSLGFDQLSAGGVGESQREVNRFYEAHTCGLVAKTSVLCWGSTFSGQIGDQSPACSRLDGLQGCRRILPFVALDDGRTGIGGQKGTVRSVLVGGRHSCALLNVQQSFQLLCWGGMNTFALNFGSRPSPVWIGTRFQPEYPVAAGGEFICIGADFLQCGGRNGNGQLADNTTLDHSLGRAFAADGTPLFAAQFLTAGLAHACTWSVSVSCWGLPEQPTTGSPGSSPKLMAVPGGEVRQVSAGGGFTCALSSARDVYCWNVGAVTPQLVTGGLKFESISAGAGHTCGVTLDGSLYCWGRNDKGQLGDGTTINRLAPVRVGEAP